MNYKIIREIGKGGFGVVNLIEDSQNNQFALKTYNFNSNIDGLEEQAKKRFIKEAKYQQQIKHQNVVEIIDVNTESNNPYYIMKLADSSMLEDMRLNYLNRTNFIDCFYDIMAGLEEIHSLHIYHRDLKPANVLRFGETYAIGDFGLMSLNQTGITTLTKTGMAKNTDMYTAPEITQDLKFASIQSDIYSLACILHDFVGQSNRIPCSEISESSEYHDILLISTRRDPTRRFSSVAAFREALNSINKNIEPVKTKSAETILDLLKKPSENFDENDILKLSDFLSSNIIQDEKNIILGEITINHINKIRKSRYDQFIARSFCEYVRNNRFDFNFCDTLASRIIAFMENSTIDIISEGIFALLYLGTNHNRWYVEGKAFNYLSNSEINDKLLSRLIMEIRVDGKKFCSAINHLFYSINEKKERLNPQILKVYNEICTQ